MDRLSSTLITEMMEEVWYLKGVNKLSKRIVSCQKCYPVLMKENKQGLNRC